MFACDTNLVLSHFEIPTYGIIKRPLKTETIRHISNRMLKKIILSSDDEENYL